MTYFDNHGHESIVLSDSNIDGIVAHCRQLSAAGKLKMRFVKDGDKKTGRNVFIIGAKSMADIKEEFQRTFGKAKKKKKKEERAFEFEEVKDNEHGWIGSRGGIYGKGKKNHKRMQKITYQGKVETNKAFCKRYKSGICAFHEPHDEPTHDCDRIHLLGGIQILKCGAFLAMSPFQNLTEKNSVLVNLGKHTTSCKICLGIKGKKLSRKRKNQTSLEMMWKVKKPRIEKRVSSVFEEEHEQTKEREEGNSQSQFQELIDLQDSNLEEDKRKNERKETRNHSF